MSRRLEPTPPTLPAVSAGATVADAAPAIESPAPAEAGIRIVARNTVHLLGAQIATGVISFVTTALLARRLGAESYGVLFTSWALVSLAFIFVDWGSDAYLVRAIAQTHGLAGELLGTGLALRCTLAVAMFLPVMGVSWLLRYPQTTRLATALTVACLTFNTLGGVYSALFRGFERMDYEAAARVAGAVLNAVAILLALQFGFGLLGVLAWQAFAAAATIPVLLWLARRLGVRRLEVHRNRALLFFRGGSPFLFFNLMIAVQTNFGTIILSKLSSQSVVGWYGAASRFAGILLFPITILGSVLFPTLSRLSGEDPKGYQRTVRGGLRVMLVLALPVALGTFLFADWAVALLYGREGFAPAAANLKVLSLFLFLLFLTMPLGTAVLAAGRQIPFAYAKGVSAALYLVSNTILIPFFQARFGNGGLGAAAATAVVELLMLAAALKLLPRGTIGSEVVLHGGRTFAAGGGMAAVAVAIRNVSPFLAISLSLLTYTVLLVAFGGIRARDLSLLREAIPLRRAKVAPTRVQDGQL